MAKADLYVKGMARLVHFYALMIMQRRFCGKEIMNAQVDWTRCCEKEEKHRVLKTDINKFTIWHTIIFTAIYHKGLLRKRENKYRCGQSFSFPAVPSWKTFWPQRRPMAWRALVPCCSVSREASEGPPCSDSSVARLLCGRPSGVDNPSQWCTLPSLEPEIKEI